MFIITGVRGSGKTVLMTEVSKKIARQKDWITIELNPERDMLTGLAAKLYSEQNLAELFRDAKINLSFFGFGLEIGGTEPITDIEIALSRMLSCLKKQGKRVLITIDEVSSTKEMKIFASAFQILIRQDLPVFLLMTGLYENINTLQNEKNLTFLYRAPKIELGPLNIGTIAENYRNNLSLDEPGALSAAKLTKGYSFAFQVLGHFAWENRGINDVVRSSYKQYLEDYVYEKIWAELSVKDREVAYAIAMTESGKILEIRNRLGMETNQINPYRKRLIRRGIVSGDTYGYLFFTLPLFETFVKEVYPETM
ncbi:MAG: ATP-binding protein [Firmicutes bacterium]|nr:ATP-binding protein [Bacillota bacterium]